MMPHISVESLLRNTLLKHVCSIHRFLTCMITYEIDSTGPMAIEQTSSTQVTRNPLSTHHGVFEADY
jgi:hypothetical protein